MKKIVIIGHDPVLTGLADQVLKGTYETVSFAGVKPALDYIYNSQPSLVIVDIRPDDAHTISVLNDLKADPLFRSLPILAVLPEPGSASAWESLMIDDYIKKADLDSEILGRVNLCILRSERIVEANPLTRLPGNISINKQIQGRLDRGEIFALAYADLDHFKPFNDQYGFSRGDEVIKITGRLILNMVKERQPQGSFIGHVGGDDFIYIMDVALVETTSREIVRVFDQIIPTFYDPEDRLQGAIQSYDRQGNQRSFPITSLSIGITDNGTRTFTHYGEMTEAASEMKKFAKRTRGSCIRPDKRRSKDGNP